jgi:hypothetical protein
VCGSIVAIGKLACDVPLYVHHILHDNSSSSFLNGGAPLLTAAPHFRTGLRWMRSNMHMNERMYVLTRWQAAGALSVCGDFSKHGVHLIHYMHRDALADCVGVQLISS